jgi:hypothetical protein
MYIRTDIKKLSVKTFTMVLSVPMDNHQILFNVYINFCFDEFWSVGRKGGMFFFQNIFVEVSQVWLSQLSAILS